MKKADKGAETIGAVLRLARLKSDQSLEEAASRTRIRESHLRAIEDMNIEALPGRTYALGFVRSYADFLGLDPQEALARFKKETGLDKSPRTQKYEFFDGEERTVKRGGPSILAILVIVFASVWVVWKIAKPTPEAGAELAARAFLNQIFGATEPGETAQEAPRAPTDGEASVLDRLLAEGDALEAADEAPVLVAEADTSVDTDTADAATPADSPPVETQTVAETATTEQAEAAPTSVAEENVAETRVAEAAIVDAATESDSRASVEDEAADVAEASAPSAEPQPVASAEPEATADVEQDAVDAPETERVAALVADSVDAGENAAQPASDQTEQIESVEPQTEEPVAVAEEAAAPQNNRPQRSAVPLGVARGVSPDNSRIVIRALMPSYLRITDAAGVDLIDGRVDAGDIFYVPDRPGVLLTVLNAGGFELEIDGARAGLLGGPGEAINDLTLDADALDQALQ